MATRPCKPGSDLKGIWQTLLPDMPMPACGTSDKPDAKANTIQSDTMTPRDQDAARPDTPRAQRARERGAI